MTLIITHISKYGIIHASDSNLTSGDGASVGEGRKTFPIPHFKAGLTVAGAYSVGGKDISDWMANFIQARATSGVSSLANFASKLVSDLEKQMSPEEKAAGSAIQIAGYVEESGTCHPELWYVRNVHINPNTGEYVVESHFQATEDFWTGDCPKLKLMQAFQQGGCHIYVNGFASGRISFVMLQPVMKQFFDGVWSNPNWKFRPPRSLEETETLIKLYIQIIGTLFHLSDYRARFIGGEPQAYVIPQPSNIAGTC